MNNLINNDLLTAIENMQLPPTLYSILEIIVNENSENKKMTKDLALITSLKDVKVLNLFAYTGAASCACLSAGTPSSL